jgi:hypothetical protein
MVKKIDVERMAQLMREAVGNTPMPEGLSEVDRAIVEAVFAASEAQIGLMRWWAGQANDGVNRDVIEAALANVLTNQILNAAMSLYDSPLEAIEFCHSIIGGMPILMQRGLKAYTGQPDDKSLILGKGVTYVPEKEVD